MIMNELEKIISKAFEEKQNVNNQDNTFYGTDFVEITPLNFEIENSPDGHALHSVVPVLSVYVPERHAWHSEAPE